VDRKAYQDRLVTPAQAVTVIPNGARICMALGVAQPPALLNALARRAASEGIEGASLYYLLSSPVAGQSVLRRELNHRLRPMSLFHSAVERALDDLAAQEKTACIDLIPTAFSKVPRLLCEEIGVDTLITQVAPMDERGEFSLGTNIDYAHGVARRCERVIVEVNRNMPRTFGDMHDPAFRRDRHC
jgi:itaconate CoA-transferase